MSSLREFSIRVDNSTAVYSPGDTITGEVFVDLNEAQTCRGISLRFKGKAKVKWVEHRHSSNNRRTYSAEENYFGTEVYVVGASHGEIQLVGGQHIFPFTFTLPLNIPNSFTHEYGDVVYSIKAVMDIAWALDPETCLPLTVYSPFDLNQAPSHAIEDELHEEYCWCVLPCVSEGFMEAQIYIPKSSCAVGDQLDVFIEIDMNSPSVDIFGIELRLKQILEFHADGRTKTQSETVERSTNNGPFERNTRINLRLQVPSVLHSGLQHCNLINIMYHLGIKFLVSDCHCDTKKYYAIMIGAKSTVPTEEQARPIPPASAPSDLEIMGIPSIPLVPIPGMIGDSTAISETLNPPPYASAPPIGFQIPNPSAPVDPTVATMPPPSYESVMAEEVKK